MYGGFLKSRTRDFEEACFLLEIRAGEGTLLLSNFPGRTK
jgi:hypothetical protein